MIPPNVAERCRTNIPEELRATPRWLLHNAKKEPLNPHTGQVSDAHSPNTLTSFEKALEAGAVMDNAVGLGFSLAPPFCGVDLDHCRANEIVAREPGEISKALKSYCEVSLSGTGLHVIVKAKKPGSDCKRTVPSWGDPKSAIEIYDKQYFTMSGVPVLWSVPEIADRQEELDTLYRRFFRAESPRSTGAPDVDARVSAVVMDPEAKAPEVALNNLIISDPRFQATWERKRKDLKDQSGSGYCMALAHAAKAAGWSDQDAVNLMIHWRRDHHEDLKIDRPEWYVKHVIAKVEESPSLAADRLEAERSRPPQEVMADLSRLLGIEVVGFVQSSPTDAIYSLELRGGQTIPLGNARQLLVVDHSRAALMEARQVLIPEKITRGKWLKIVASLLKVVRVENRSAETPTDTLLTEICEWVGNRWNETDTRSFVRGGLLYIHATQLLILINRERIISGSRIELATFRDQLRQLGFESCRVMRKNKSGVNVCRGFWRAPVSGLVARDSNVSVAIASLQKEKQKAKDKARQDAEDTAGWKRVLAGARKTAAKDEEDPKTAERGVYLDA